MTRARTRAVMARKLPEAIRLRDAAGDHYRAGDELRAEAGRLVDQIAALKAGVHPLPVGGLQLPRAARP